MGLLSSPSELLSYLPGAGLHGCIGGAYPPRPRAGRPCYFYASNLESSARAYKRSQQCVAVVITVDLLYKLHHRINDQPSKWDIGISPPVSGRVSPARAMKNQRRAWRRSSRAWGLATRAGALRRICANCRRRPLGERSLGKYLGSRARLLSLGELWKERREKPPWMPAAPHPPRPVLGSLQGLGGKVGSRGEGGPGATGKAGAALALRCPPPAPLRTPGRRASGHFLGHSVPTSPRPPIKEHHALLPDS